MSFPSTRVITERRMTMALSIKKHGFSVQLLVAVLVVSFSLVTAGGTAQATTIANTDPGHIKRPDGIPAQGGEDEIWVYPRGVSTPDPKTGKTRDVTNVQWAVDMVAEGGIVRLKPIDPDDGEQKPFHFGPNDEDSPINTVFLRKSVTATGEVIKDARGNILVCHTKVEYGHRPFVLAKVGAQFTVENIWFDKSGFDSVHVHSCAVAWIRYNKITNIKPGISLATGYPHAYGILLAEAPLTSLGLGLGKLGVVLVEKNEIDMFGPKGGPYDPTGWLNHSAALLNAYVLPSADTKEVYFEDNVISNPGYNGISMIGAMGAETYVGRNRIYQRTYTYTDDLNPDNPLRNSIGVHAVRWRHPVVLAGPVEIEGNEIYNVPTLGISVRDAQNSTVTNNYVEMVDIDGEVLENSSGFYFESKNCTVEGNTVIGTSYYGIRLWADANGNYLSDNNLSALMVDEAHVCLGPGTYKNEVYDTAGLIVIDDGHNKIRR